MRHYSDDMNISFNWAAYTGHLPVVIWLHENINEGCTYRAMNLAVRNDHLPIVIYLHKNRNE